MIIVLLQIVFVVGSVFFLTWILMSVFFSEKERGEDYTERMLLSVRNDLEWRLRDYFYRLTDCFLLSRILSSKAAFLIGDAKEDFLFDEFLKMGDSLPAFWNNVGELLNEEFLGYAHDVRDLTKKTIELSKAEALLNLTCKEVSEKMNENEKEWQILYLELEDFLSKAKPLSK